MANPFRSLPFDVSVNDSIDTVRLSKGICTQHIDRDLWESALYKPAEMDYIVNSFMSEYKRAEGERYQGMSYTMKNSFDDPMRIGSTRAVSIPKAADSRLLLLCDV